MRQSYKKKKLVRSTWKGLFIYNKLFTEIERKKKIADVKLFKRRRISIRAKVGIVKNIKNCVILSSFVNAIFKLHTGKRDFFFRIEDSNKVGYKFGDFIFTKAIPNYFSKKKNKKRGRR